MAFNLFLKINGITGESVDPAHPGSIEVFSFSTGVSNPGSIKSGTPVFGFAQDINMLAQYSKASTPLFLASATGQVFTTATLSMRTTGASFDFLKIKLDNLMVSSYSGSGASGGDDAPVDSFSLQYGQLTYTYVAVVGGVAQPAVTHSFNFLTNTKT